MQSLLKTISSEGVEKERVLQVGEKIILILLGAKKEKTLDELRSRKYFDKITGTTRQSVKPETLGSTTNAAH